MFNMFLLARYMFMSEMHLRQSGLCIMLAYLLLSMKKKQKISKKQQNSGYNYQNEVDKTCFQHYVAYGAYKDLPIKTADDKLLRDRAFQIADNQEFGGYQQGVASVIYKFFDKKSRDNIYRGTGIWDAVPEN